MVAQPVAVKYMEAESGVGVGVEMVEDMVERAAYAALPRKHRYMLFLFLNPPQFPAHTDLEHTCFGCIAANRPQTCIRV